MLNTSKDEQKADARVEQIIDAINNQDRDALKSLYSEKALEEADNFDSEMDTFFGFIQGNIISWEREYGVDSSEKIDYGKKSIMYRYIINVETDIDSYVLFVIDYYVDTIDPENEGLYMLQVRTSGYSEALGPWQDRMRPGFYIPEALGK